MCFWAEIELRLIHLILPERSIVILVTRSRIHLPALKRFSVSKIGSSVRLSMGCRTSIPFVSCPRKSAVCTVSPANNRHSKWIEISKDDGNKSLYLLIGRERNRCICWWKEIVVFVAESADQGPQPSTKDHSNPRVQMSSLLPSQADTLIWNHLVRTEHYKEFCGSWSRRTDLTGTEHSTLEKVIGNSDVNNEFTVLHDCNLLDSSWWVHPSA